MRILVVTQWPRVENRAWKQDLIGRLRGKGAEKPAAIGVSLRVQHYSPCWVALRKDRALAMLVFECAARHVLPPLVVALVEVSCWGSFGLRSCGCFLPGWQV